MYSKKLVVFEKLNGLLRIMIEIAGELEGCTMSLVLEKHY